MHISEYDGSQLRLILIGMITDPKVCSRICGILEKKKGLKFDQEWADLIARWCRDHLKKYGTPPNGSIQLIFRKWAESTRSDSKTINQIESLLDYMSEEYSGSVAGNSDFVLDIASDYFNKHRLQSVVEEVGDNITTGRVDAAFSQLNTTVKIELGYSSVINPLQDVEVWMESFNDERDKPIFEYPGDLGRLVGQSFTKGTLFSFMGVDKAGKSFYLMDAAFRALKRRHRVAYFEVGDLGKEETIQRFGQRILNQTIHDESVKWPVGWEPDQDKPITKWRHRAGVSIGHALKRIRKHTRGRDLLRLSCHPNSTINVAGISSLLQDWAREGCWIPDMVIIDYADILAPPDGFPESNDQIDETWKQLRRLSQTNNCLVLTATQTGAQAYKKRGSALSRVDFSGRKTKMAHVNGMLGINATPEEMRSNVTRINWIVRRKGGGCETEQVAVAGCFAAGTPIILSKYASYRKPLVKDPTAGTEDKKPG